MSNAAHDENDRPTAICISMTDGTTIIPIKVNPTTHALHADNNTTGTDYGNNGGIAMLDENSVAVWTAESSDGSGNIVEIYGNSGVLINSN
jgi:hypothetical protein